MSERVSVIGGGAWGTAFSIYLAKMGRDVCLWIYEKELCEIISTRRENTYYLPGFFIPHSIEVTNELSFAVEYSDDILISVPSYAFRSVFSAITEDLDGKKILILTKGLEPETCKRMSEVATELLGKKKTQIAVLSGPSFAKEVAQGFFTSVVVASHDRGSAEYFQNLTHSDIFRVYISDDLIGVELGGALKNVMAIGAGMIQGLELGTNTLCAYLTRALAEMKRFGRAMGAREMTFMGLSGVGDLILTSFGPLSRNRWFGIQIAKGGKPKEIIESEKRVIEGYHTLSAVYKLSRSLNVEMPIVTELYRIVYEGKDVLSSIRDITQRKKREEEG